MKKSNYSNKAASKVKAGGMKSNSQGGKIVKSNEMRSDVTASVSNKNPYPQGLA